MVSKKDVLADQNRNNEGWSRDLKALGLVDGSRLNRTRLKTISKYIWSQEGQAANFEKLTAMLKQQDEALQKEISKKLKAIHKKKKMQRKQRKVGRKRR